MSVVKSKRGKSKVEFEQIYFQLVDNIDNLVEHNFYAGNVLVEKKERKGTEKPISERYQ